jgi:Flp pilus assembly protein TadB
VSAALPVLLGGGAGLGLAIIIAEAWPAPPRLGAVLARLDEPPAAAPAAGARGGPAAGAWLARSARLAVPRADLAILGRSPETFFAHKLTAALAGLGSFSVMAAVLATAGIRVPWEAPALAVLAAGAGMWFFPDWDVRSEARRRRADFLHAWTAYLQLVRLARTAGAGTTEALEYAASKGDGWAFARIREAVGRARRAHQPPWEGLAELGRELGVPEVTELADTVQVSGSEGTRITATLAAKTESLRGKLLSDTRTQANSRTATMIVPLTLLGFGFVLLLAYPAFYQLIFGT